MRYVVTGTSGMLGSEIDREFSSLGWERLEPPTDRRLFALWRSPSTGEFEPDFRCEGYLEWLAALDPKPDVFVHSGAIVGTTRCETLAEETWSCNAAAPRDLARILAERRIYTVFLATASELSPDDYGLAKPISMSRTPANPRTRYGLTKLAGRLFAVDAFAREPELLLQVYPSFGFGGIRDGDSCVADCLKCAAGLYEREPFITLSPANVKEVTPHSWISLLVRRAVEVRLSGRVPAASGRWLPYGQIVDIVRFVSDVPISPVYRPDLDYLGDFVHDLEEVAAVRERLDLPEVDLEREIRREYFGLLKALERGDPPATHEWGNAEKLAEGRGRNR